MELFMAQLVETLEALGKPFGGLLMGVRLILANFAA